MYHKKNHKTKQKRINSALSLKPIEQKKKKTNLHRNPRFKTQNPKTAYLQFRKTLGVFDRTPADKFVENKVLGELNKALFNADEVDSGLEVFIVVSDAVGEIVFEEDVLVVADLFEGESEEDSGDDHQY